jgi:hypothetical protein
MGFEKPHRRIFICISKGFIECLVVLVALLKAKKILPLPNPGRKDSSCFDHISLANRTDHG